jgi:hypothetical protein
MLPARPIVCSWCFRRFRSWARSPPLSFCRWGLACLVVAACLGWRPPFVALAVVCLATMALAFVPLPTSEPP